MLLLLWFWCILLGIGLGASNEPGIEEAYLEVTIHWDGGHLPYHSSHAQLFVSFTGTNDYFDTIVEYSKGKTVLILCGNELPGNLMSIVLYSDDLRETLFTEELDLTTLVQIVDGMLVREFPVPTVHVQMQPSLPDTSVKMSLDQ